MTILFLPQTIHLIYCQLAIAKINVTLIQVSKFTIIAGPENGGPENEKGFAIINLLFV